MLYYYAASAKGQIAASPIIPAAMFASVAAVVATITVYLIRSVFLNYSTVAKSVAICSLLALIIEVCLVGRLNVGAAAYQARALASPGPQFLYKNTIHMLDLEENLNQEVIFRWPDDKKTAMKRFLEDEKKRTLH